MDQFTRRIVGFALHAGELDGVAVCCMFNRIISKKSLPKCLISDNDPLFTFHRWRANLRILNVEEIKSMPYEPRSHPFIERVIGTIRQEYLNHMFFWNKYDLKNKLDGFQIYYNEKRAHAAVQQETPSVKYRKTTNNVIGLKNYFWESHAKGIFQLPIAA